MPFLSDQKLDDDDDDDIIEITQQEPVVTEILDDEDCERTNESTTKVGEESTIAILSDSVLDDSRNEQSDLNRNESFGGESDVEIQEPHIPITDLDDIDDVPMNILDETSTNSFTMIKIKEEPKDDFEEEEEDAFEDVGTMVSAIDNITDDLLLGEIGNGNDGDIIEQTTTITTDVSPQTPQTINSDTLTQPATNKIKINIAKSHTTTVVQPTGGSSDQVTTDSDVKGGNSDDTNCNNELDSNKDISETEISYELKDDLKGIELKKMLTVKNGYETSGLCSIM